MKSAAAASFKSCHHGGGDCGVPYSRTRRSGMSVAFVREESAEAAQEVTLPERPVSAHPNLVTPSGLRALEQAAADSHEALKAAQLVDDANAGAGRSHSPPATRATFPNVLRARNCGRSRSARKSSRSAIA
jgi:hypothetical protein